MKTYTTTEEIFAAGYWNGMTFTAEDLHAIVKSFEHFSELLAVPLKFGHEGSAEMKDGQPALGWVSKIWVDEAADPAKLMAEFSDIPELVYKSMQQKRYRTKSVELDFQVKHAGEEFDYVLTGVALLGADLPAVNVLDDLGEYVASRRKSGTYSAGRHACFSVGRGALFNNTEADMPEIDDLKKEVSDLKAELANAQKESLEYKTKCEAFEKADLARKEAEAAAAFTRRVDDNKAQMEELVKAGLLTPGKRDEFAKGMTDDAACTGIEFTLSALKEMGESKGLFSKSGAQGGGDAGDTSPPDVALANAIQEIQDKENVDFSTAQQRAFQRNPQLARDYINMN